MVCVVVYEKTQRVGYRLSFYGSCCFKMEFSLIDFLKIIKSKIWIIIVSVVVCCAIALGYGVLTIRPLYSANATVLIASGALFKDENEHKGSTEYITTGELSTTFALMKSFKGILQQSVDFYETALSEANAVGLEGEYSVASLSRMASISYQEESLILVISVTGGTKRDAVTLVNALANAAPECIMEKLGRTSAVVLNVDTVATDVSVGLDTYFFLFFIIGIVLGVMIIFLVDKFDRTIKNEKDYLENYQVPLLGTVPEFENVKKKRGVSSR